MHSLLRLPVSMVPENPEFLLTVFSLLVLILAKVVAMQDHVGVQFYLLEYVSYAIAYLRLAVIVSNFRNIHRVEALAAASNNTALI